MHHIRISDKVFLFIVRLCVGFTGGPRPDTRCTRENSKQAGGEEKEAKKGAMGYYDLLQKICESLINLIACQCACQLRLA